MFIVLSRGGGLLCQRALTELRLSMTETLRHSSKDITTRLELLDQWSK